MAKTKTTAVAVIEDQVKDLTLSISSMEVNAEVLTKEDFSKGIEALDMLSNLIDSAKKTLNSKIKDTLQNNFLDTGEQTIKNATHNFTYVPASERETVDNKMLKKDYPEIYRKVVKISKINDSVRITKVKKEEDKPIEVEGE